MLYLIHGNDGTRGRAKAHELIAALHAKKPDAELFSLDAENWKEASFEEFIGGQGLFQRKYIVFLDRLLLNKEAEAFVLDHLKQIKESDNVFLFLEGAIDAKTRKRFETHAEKVQEFSLDKGKKDEFKIFALTDAFGRRDRKGLWVLFEKAVAAGSSPEEIHGILFWQVKSMIVAGSSSKAESGLNPFVYGKAAGFLKNFSLPELKQYSSRLMRMVHEAHGGLYDLDVALERFILTV